MKITHYFFVFAAVITISLFNTLSATAINTGFSIESFPDEKKESVITNKDLHFLTEEPEKRAIECFDVNENGLIAIGCSESDKKTISVYSSEGIFQYGYNFFYGGTYAIEWDRDNINIFLVRSDLIVNVTPNGEMLDVYNVPYNKENRVYYTEVLLANKKSVGNTEYILANDMGVFNIFAFGYSQIIIKDVSGVERTIYDIKTNQLFSFLFFVICISIAIALIIYSAYIQAKQAKKKN